MKLVKTILSWLYGLAVALRNWLYDAGILRVRKFDIPILCVGNLTVGGTGKTPAVEFLIRELKDKYSVAVLSRGYGRRTKGYLEVEDGSSFLSVGDEPKQIKRHFPDTVVVVCENRRKGIERIRRDHPDVNLVIMDDGFQHRSVEASENIILADYTRPPYNDRMLPLGRLRDSMSQLYRANFILVTKCPPYLSPIDRRIIVKSLRQFPYQSVYFTAIRYEPLRPLFPDEAAEAPKPGMKIVALAAVGNPAPFASELERNYEVAEKLFFGDHHVYRVSEMKKLQCLLNDNPGIGAVITTEKDAVKLANRRLIPAEVRSRLYVLPAGITFIDRDGNEFIQKLTKNVGRD